MKTLCRERAVSGIGGGKDSRGKTARNLAVG